MGTEKIGLDLVCADATASLFGFLDPSIAPSFLYYAYIPIIFVSLIFAVFIFLATKGDLAGRLLLWAAILFSINLIGEVLLWISTPVLLIHVVWQNLVILHMLIIALIAYFAYVFGTGGKDLPTVWKWGWLAIMTPVILLVPTSHNLAGFDLDNCESVQGDLWTLVYFVQALMALTILVFVIRRAIKATTSVERNKLIILGTGVTIFNIIFILSYAIGDYFLLYDTNLLGPVGMVSLLVTLTYLIVVHHAFNLRVIGAQALVGGVVVLIFGALFVRSIDNVRLVLIGTLILVIILGTVLVKGVLREVEQRKRIEKLATDLSNANERLKEVDQLKNEFLSVATHQLRAPITAIRGYAANMSEGSYGEVPEYMKEPLHVVQESTRLMANSIDDYLNISRIEQGRMKYEKSTFNIADIAKRVVEELTPVASSRKLTLSYTGTDSLMVNADIGKMKQVIANLTDNAIKYTEQGGVTVTAETKDGRARVTISDTGIGIPKEEIGLLFEKFKRARGANKVNTTGTGLGLYVAKMLSEGNGGKVWAESDGAGKGSRFIVELPL